MGFSAKPHKIYKWESEVEAELVYLFSTFDFKNFEVHSDEMEEAEFWTGNTSRNSDPSNGSNR